MLVTNTPSMFFMDSLRGNSRDCFDVADAWPVRVLQVGVGHGVEFVRGEKDVPAPSRGFRGRCVGIGGRRIDRPSETSATAVFAALLPQPLRFSLGRCVLLRIDRANRQARCTAPQDYQLLSGPPFRHFRRRRTAAKDLCQSRAKM